MVKLKYIGLIALSFLTFALHSGCNKKDDYPSDMIDYLSTVREIGRLQLSEMSLTKVGRICDPSFRDAETLQEKAEAVIDKMKIGTRIGVYSYSTYLTAYIDMMEISPSDLVIDTLGSTVRITLPPVKIDWDGRDMELEEIHYRVNGMRSNIGVRERASLKSRMAEQLKNEVKTDPAIESSLMESAMVKAQSYFTELFDNFGLKSQISFRKR